MPWFFFDYRDGRGRLERDDDGVEFPSLEAAYEDAGRAARDMYAEAQREGQNAIDHAFEIRDEAGRMLLILPFAEALSKLQSRKG